MFPFLLLLCLSPFLSELYIADMAEENHNVACCTPFVGCGMTFRTAFGLSSNAFPPRRLQLFTCMNPRAGLSGNSTPLRFSDLQETSFDVSWLLEVSGRWRKSTKGNDAVVDENTLEMEEIGAGCLAGKFDTCFKGEGPFVPCWIR